MCELLEGGIQVDQQGLGEDEMVGLVGVKDALGQYL